MAVLGERITRLLQSDFLQAKNAIESAHNICIISHRSPDGDAVGSNLSLKAALKQMGKHVTSACIDPVPKDSVWLEDGDKFQLDFNYNDFDLIVSVDCAVTKLIGFDKKKPEVLSGQKPFINFDHHLGNDKFGTINLVDTSACSTAIIMFTFLQFLKTDIRPSIATSLLHGIYFDTGGMMHSNSTIEVFEIAGKLMELGADLKQISKTLFHTTPVNKLRLWGRILERTYINDEGVTVSAVNEDDYKVCNADSRDTGGAIDFLNAVPNAEYCVLLSEDTKKGIVKGSLRTQKEDLDLTKVAGKWGGGGHSKASGFGVSGKLKPVISWEVVGDTEHDTKELNTEPIKF